MSLIEVKNNACFGIHIAATAVHQNMQPERLSFDRILSSSGAIDVLLLTFHSEWNIIPKPMNPQLSLQHHFRSSKTNPLTDDFLLSDRHTLFHRPLPVCHMFFGARSLFAAYYAHPKQQSRPIRFESHV